MTNAELTQAVDRSDSGSRNRRRVRIGTVETDVRQKTIKVRIERLSRHGKYGKSAPRRLDSRRWLSSEKSRCCAAG